MTDFSWRIDDEDGDPELTGTPQPLVVTWRIIRDALRRAWRWCVGAAAVGGVAGMLALAALPHPASATATLLLVHPNADDPTAMSTDVSLLMTRAVASQVITRLRLPDTTPDALHQSISAEPLTDQLLVLTVTAPDDAAARARATTVIDTFLSFRAEQLRSISEGIVAGYQQRISDLQGKVDTLTKDYEGLHGSSPADQVAASDILGQRAQLGSQISSMQQAVEDARLQTEGAVTATHVIDAPYANPRVSRRTLLLYGASGAVLLGSLTVGVVLFRALTSDRLRRRRDIADALGVPVRVGVGSVRAPGRLTRAGRRISARLARALTRTSRGRYGHGPRSRSERDLEALVRALGCALPADSSRGFHRGHAPHRGQRGPGEPSGPTTLALAAIDDTDTAARVLLALADRRSQQGSRVVLVDLTDRGSLEAARRRRSDRAFGRAAGSGEEDGRSRPVLLRPPGQACLSRGPLRAARRPSAPPDPSDDIRWADWEDADVALVLVELDPGLDVDTLTTWTSCIVPLVSAGRASRELLHTVAEMVASAHLEMPFALAEGVDRGDETSGATEPPRTEATTTLAGLR